MNLSYSLPEMEPTPITLIGDAVPFGLALNQVFEQAGGLFTYGIEGGIFYVVKQPYDMLPGPE
jgi:hypothetical protein